MGVIIDKVAGSELALSIGSTLNLTSEQVGMRAGMLVTSVFPILGAACVCAIVIYHKKVSSALK